MRYLLNVTSIVHPEYVKMWLEYIEKKFLPKSKALDGVKDAALLKVHTQQEDGDETYSVQISADDPNVLEAFNHKVFAELQHEVETIFKDRVMLFATVLERLK